MTYQVKSRFQSLPFKCNLQRYITDERCKACHFANASKKHCCTKDAPSYCLFVPRYLDTVAAGGGGGGGGGGGSGAGGGAGATGGGEM
jgi:hypothetical protein